MPTDAIVAAFNEAPRIGAVLDALHAAGCVDRTIVVSDGSADATCEVAAAHGADVVLCLPRNGGKGQAMRAGLAASGADAVVFADADLRGLRADHVCRLVRAVAAGTFGQACGLRDTGDERLNRVAMRLPIITGERCVRRAVLDRIPARFFDGYRIEVAINAACAALGLPTFLTVLDGVTIVPKEAKVGMVHARGQYDRMFRAVAEAWCEARRYPF